MSEDIASYSEQLFLELLSSALNHRAVDRSLFVDVSTETWRALLAMANKQSMPAIIAERILSLPKECLPPRKACLKLAMLLHAVEERNARQIESLDKLRQAYEAEDLPFVLLKGQSVGYYYPQPEHRSSGDIDIYLYRRGDYERANDWARQQGRRIVNEALYETAYYFDQHTLVENHLYIAYFGRRKYDDRLSEMVEQVVRTDSFERMRIAGEIYLTLPSELNAVYIFQHIMHHFAYLGISFRQISDWLFYLEHHHEQMNIELFVKYAEALDLLQPMKIFARMAVDYLGIGAEIFPFAISEDKALAEVVLREILSGGNFGFEAFKGKTFGNIWARRWYMFRCTLRRSFRISAVSPHHIRGIGWVAILNRFRMLLR